MKIITLLAFWVAIVGTSYKQMSEVKAQKLDPKSYIGLRYQEDPQELKYMGGWLIDGKDHGVRHMVSSNCQEPPCPQGTLQMLWLQKIISYNSAGIPLWEVLDAIALPNNYDKDKINNIFIACEINRKLDPELVVIAKYEQDKEYITQIIKAWRANRSIKKFQEIPPQNIRCINPGWGV